MTKKTIFLALVVIAALSACKSQYDLMLESNDADAKYKAAFDYFNKKKYTRSATLFESLAVLTNGTERDDTVQYYWGLSNYLNKDYFTAETNFQQFINNFPISPFNADAQYYRIDCLYRATYRYELDQKPTYTAMTQISQYLLEHPDSEHAEFCRIMLEDLNERLDKKAYENAKLYYKMEDYKASRVAFKNVLKEDAENVYREEILYYSAMSSYKYAVNSVKAKQKERYLQFVDDYLNFIGEYPESDFRNELDRLYEKISSAD